MAYLIQKKEDGSSENQWELGDSALVVGRGDEVDVSVADEKMSRRHFVIEQRGSSHFIVDQKSKNGTRVNGRSITEEPLSTEAHILAGNTSFVFHSGFGSMIEKLVEEPRDYHTQMRKIPPEHSS